MRTSHTPGFEISANVQPIELKRQKTTLELYKRAKRIAKNHPCRQVIYKWKKLANKDLSCMVDSLNTKHHLPENWRNIERVRKELAPNMNCQHPTIKTTLISKANKNTDPTILKTTTLVTTDSYSQRLDPSLNWWISIQGYCSFRLWDNHLLPRQNTRINLHPMRCLLLQLRCRITNHRLCKHSDISHALDTEPELATNIIIFTDWVDRELIERPPYSHRISIILWTL